MAVDCSYECSYSLEIRNKLNFLGRHVKFHLSIVVKNVHVYELNFSCNYIRLECDK